MDIVQKLIKLGLIEPNFADYVEFANPYHDERGRFTSAPSGGVLSKEFQPKGKAIGGGVRKSKPAPSEPYGPPSPPPPPKVGETYAEVSKRINEVTSREHGVTHEKGYRDSGKSYLAKIGGVDQKYGLDRNFLESGNVDWSGYNYKKGKGTFVKTHDIPKEGGVYEEQEKGDRQGYVYYPAIRDGKAQLIAAKIKPDTLNEAVRMLHKANLPISELPKAMSDSDHLRSQLGVKEIVQRWIDAKKTTAMSDDRIAALLSCSILGRSII